MGNYNTHIRSKEERGPMKFKELRDRINELWDNEMINDEAEVYFEDKLAGYGGAIDDVEYIDIDKDGDLILVNTICDEEE